MGKGGWMSTRNILWHLSFIGFGVNYMLRININIAIVAMVRSRPKVSENVTHVSDCLQSLVLPTNESYDVNTTTTPTAAALIDYANQGRYDWDEYQQGLVLGAFFWLHWVLQVPAGMLAQRFGPKKIFGITNFSCALLCVLVPIAASVDYRLLIAIRVVQGFIAGAAWPSMHTMTANWIPPNDRSKFITAYMGSSVGVAITYPMYGLIIDWFGWPMVFHSTALIGSVWFLAWWFLVFDSPEKHPRISDEERSYIQSCLGQTVTTKKKLPTPWKSILTSVPLWMNVIAQWGGIWSLFTLMTQAPTYFKQVHGWNMKMTGILSGAPHLCRVGIALLVSTSGDYLLKKQLISRTNLRKAATFLCTIVQAAFLLGIAYAGCDYTLAIVCLIAAVGISGSVSTGPLASVVDMSPNFAGILLGIVNGLSIVPGFISPIIVGLLTLNGQTTYQWRWVFLIIVVKLTICGVLYMLFSSSELQPWNSPIPPEEEMKSLSEDKQMRRSLLLLAEENETADEKK